MSPKEKAYDIFNKMCNSVDELLPYDVKECALIAVDEILWLLNEIDYDIYSDGEILFYNEVKQELEKL